MRDPEMVARAGYAAARLEQAWERWRALHGLSGSSDPLASYVGYSHMEPMGQPRVVIGVDAAEAEFFADFLEGHDCGVPGRGGEASASPAAGRPVTSRPAAGAPAAEARPVNGSGRLPVNGPGSPLDSGALYPPVSGPQPVMANGSPRSAEASASEPMARLMEDTDPHARPAAERPVTGGPQAPAPPVTRAFPAPVPTFTPIEETGPGGFAGEPGPAEPRAAVDRPAASPPDVIAAELAGWASGELPGQASEQLASWAAAEAPGGRALDRSRSAR
jgi:hypothetical protein